MANDDEIRQLREQVRLLTERMFRIEQQLGIGTRIARRLLNRLPRRRR